MTGVLDLIVLILGQLWNAIFGTYLFWIVIILVAMQYRRIAKMRENLFGIKGNTVINDTLTATLYGIAGGIAGSFLLVLTGINLAGIGIGYIWPLALFLMLINPRFLCFSYAGGIIALSKLLLGTPNIDIPQLMGLIAILHLVESFLISVSGHVGATPIYTKNAGGQLVGGFTLQKFWPLPIVAVAFFSDPSLIALPPMPEWWPIIKFEQGFMQNTPVMLIPFVAGLGYGDLALAHTPVEKSKMSARNLSIFSLVLLLLALLASRIELFEYVAAIFAPLGHEAVILIGQNTELKGKPIFVPPIRGVRVLEAVPNTAAEALGLSAGDIIYAVNGEAVNSKRDLEALLWGRPDLIEIEYLTHTGSKWERSTTGLKPFQPLGIIAVPEGGEYAYTEVVNRSIIMRIIGRLRALIKRK